MLFNRKKKTKQNEDFGRFFINNYPKVKNFVKQILMLEQDAEDVTQDIFLKLIDRPDIWEDTEKANNYLFKMAKNHVFNFIRRKKLERTYQSGHSFQYNFEDDFEVENKYHVKEIELILTYTIEQMPERRKEIFKLSRLEGKSNAQIAELLNMSIRTVERHIYLALADLKKSLFFHISD